MSEEVTKGEKREKKRQKKRKHKTSGASVKLLQEIIIRRAKEASKEGSSVASNSE